MRRFLLAFLSMLSVLVLAPVFAGCGSESAAQDADDSPPAGTIQVKMFDNSFKPDQITVTKGTTVTFKLPNVGQLPHNMHIASARGVYRESPWLSKPALSNPGETGTLVWEVPGEAGTYNFRCDIHEVEMVGAITVE